MGNLNSKLSAVSVFALCQGSIASFRSRSPVVGLTVYPCLEVAVRSGEVTNSFISSGRFAFASDRDNLAVLINLFGTHICSQFTADYNNLTNLKIGECLEFSTI